MRLKGKRILITGGTRGIGRAIAECCLAEGASIVVASEEAELNDWEVPFIQADLSTGDAPGELVRAAHELLGGLDGCVHCAGVYPEGNPAGRTPLQLWDLTVNVKARGGYLLAHEFARLAEDGGSFVGVTSINAEQSEPDHMAYDAACAALGGVVRAFAVHHAPRLRFNAMAPGLIATQLTREVSDSPDLHELACNNIPLRKLGEPVDCAGAVVFLLSDEASYITGDTLFVDGGIRANQMSRA